MGHILDLLRAEVQPLVQPARGSYHVPITPCPKYFHMTVRNSWQYKSRFGGPNMIISEDMEKYRRGGSISISLICVALAVARMVDVA